MKPGSLSVVRSAGFAAFCSALFSCQTATDPVPETTGPMVATVRFAATEDHYPDSAEWSSSKQSGTGGLTCSGGYCTDTLRLRDALGADGAQLRLWSLGIRIATLQLSQKGRSTSLDYTVSKDSFEIRVLDEFLEFKRARSDSFAKIGTVGPSHLVAFYALQVLSGAPGYSGFPGILPVGMTTDSVKRAIVALGPGFDLTWSKLADLGLGLDSSSIRVFAIELFVAGKLTDADTLSLFPRHPLRVLRPLSVSGDLVPGGAAVPLSGAYSWNKGRIVSAPTITVKTSNGADPGFVSSAKNWPSSADTSWSLSDNVTISAPLGAVPGIDTLLVVLSSDSGYSVEARAIFRVVPRDTVGPVLRLVRPGSDTTVPNETYSLVVEAMATDSSGIDSIRIRNTTRAVAPYLDTVYLGVGENRIVVQAWDKFGNVSTDTARIHRAKPVGDTTAPKIVRISPVGDTSVPWATKSLGLSWAVTDDSLVSRVALGSDVLAGASGHYPAQVELAIGRNVFVLVATDAKGNERRDTVRIERAASPGDTTAPVIVHVRPGKDTTVAWSTKTFELSCSIVDDSLLSKVWLNDTLWTGSAGSFQKTVGLAIGTNVFRVAAQDARGNKRLDTLRIVRAPDTIAPVLVFTGPSKDSSVAFDVARILVSAKASDANGIDSIRIGTVVRALDAASDSATLVTGLNKIVVQAWDKAGNRAVDTLRITRLRDTVMPKIVRATGASEQVLSYPSTGSISWTVTDNDSLKSVKIQGQVVQGSKNVYTASVPAVPGRFSIVVQAIDRAGNTLADTVWWTSKLMDSRDRKSYHILAMPDGKIWMAEELAARPSWYDDSYIDSFYTWSQAMGLPDSCDDAVCMVDTTATIQGVCPKDWHLPSNKEWQTLVDSAGITHLKSATAWISSSYGIVTDWNGDDLYGFNLRPRSSDCSGSGCTMAGKWWTVHQEAASQARAFRVTNDEDFPVRGKWNNLPVRCLRN